ncbi:MAG: hypothetical protein M3112_04085 [Actinomycetia bacterium]|nr:hypothetical protein [Actinomycetes bacterium]
MPTPDVDASAIIRAFARHKVQYVVIGGFAAELHQVAIPPTRDMDVTPEPSASNLKRLAKALRELNARFRVPDGPPGGVEIPGGVTATWLSEMVTTTLVTEAGPLDIAMRPDGTTGYDDLDESVVVMRYGGMDVPVASLIDVIRSKEAAGREKDIRVLPALRAHLRLRNA